MRRSDPREPSPVRRGLWFDDLPVGWVIRSPARTVTEADIAAFAGLSGDFNPLHVDEEFARRSAFRGRIAHGFLVESIASGLAAHTGVFDGTIAALTEVSIRFLLPVRAGDTLHVRLEVTEVDPKPARSRGSVRFQTTVYNQRGEAVIEGTWVTLMLRDPVRRRERQAGQPAQESSS